MPKIAILSAANQEYVPFLRVMLISTITTIAPDTQIAFYIIDDHLTPVAKQQLQSLVENAGHQLTFINVDAELFVNCPESDHINQTAYYRIVAPKILAKQGWHRVLYLDADTFIQTDVTPLALSSLHRNIIGAVIDPGQALTLERLGYSKTEARQALYFNSGVMVIDIDRWEDAQVSERTLDYINQFPERIVYHDQDALNAILASSTEMLEPRWNVQTSLIFQRHQPINQQYAQWYQAAIQQPAIVHFTGHDKPWNTLKGHPYTSRYLAVLNQDDGQPKIQMNPTIRVISATNSEFVPHLATLWCSIMTHNTGRHQYQFYVMEDHLTMVDRQLLERVARRYQVPVTFVQVDEQLLAQAVESARITKTAYYRILIPTIITDPAIDRILYLDCDFLCQTDLGALWQTALGDHYLAAVEDAGFHNRLAQMQVDYQSDRYFNSGMLLIDLAKWRAANISQQVVDYINQNPEKLRFHDQDALNAVLHDRWLALHPKWNAQTYMMLNEVPHPEVAGAKAYIEARQSPGLIHFCGHAKPWQGQSNHPFAPAYRYTQQLWQQQNYPRYRAMRDRENQGE
ncbi:glycosyltransferase family 8 protein [Latilactobacillus fuchuensis]|uniref:General stress A domain protein n=1 Tax=Latilactobacillus fuchuensis TaxID=164393 RepID=A0A2N9DU01_9LACO|nr:glycosyltransferase family 8 protein [Latilactobacillus fuchuensis]SPC37067.1 General stress A domain protein [Latilactobacillus fuchuensis]